MTKQKRPWLKRLLVVGLVLVAVAAGIYWYVATEEFSDTKDRKAAFTVNAIDFIREFEKNESEANKKYRDKIITVNGTGFRNRSSRYNDEYKDHRYSE